MPVEILVTASKFNDQYYNDVDFETNPDASFSTNLVGSVMDKLRVRQTILVKYYADASVTNVFTLATAGGISTLTRTSGKWSDDGISVGDLVYCDVANGFTDINLLVSFANETVLFFNDTSLNAEGDYTKMRVNGLSPLTSLYYKFGIIENNESINFISKTTGTDQGFYGVNIGFDNGGGRDTNFVDLIWLGENLDAKTGTAKCRYVSNPDDYTQEFEILHEFTVNPWYVDGGIDDLQSGILPEFLEGFKTLKYVNGFDFRRAISAPSSSKNAEIDYILGSAGGFGENLDGLSSDYEIVSIDYVDDISGIPVDSLQLQSKTNVSIVVQRKSGSFNANSRFCVYGSLLPTEDQYINITTDLLYNFMYDNAICDIGNTGLGDDYIGSTSVTYIGDTATIETSFEISQSRIDQLLNIDDVNYLITLGCADTSIDYENTDKVINITDINTFSNEIILTGLASQSNFQIFRHNQDAQSTVGFTDLYGWVEEGIFTQVVFYLDLSKKAFLNNISFKFVALNNTTGDYFELDNYTINTQNLTVSDGVQKANINTTRGYPLAEGDQFNLVSFEDTAKVGNFAIYSLKVGQKITWQSWQAILDADPVFYNSGKLLNGLNRKASNYSNINDYNIRIIYNLSLYGEADDGRTGTTPYNFISPVLNIRDYEDPADITGDIETFDFETLVDLEGNVSSNKLTLFRVTWDIEGQTITDISNYWAVHRIEVSQQQGFAISELSSINDYPTNNPLIPITGETLLKLYIDNGLIVSECYIDPSKIDLSNGINLSAEISTGDEAVIANAKLMESGVIKITESGETKILE